MIKATSLSISYSETEDRIVVDASDGQNTTRLILTRRITRRLLSAFAQLLERSSLAMKRAPADMRSEVIALEHLSAVAQARQPAAGVPAKAARPPTSSPVVIAKVDVEVTQRTFRAVFHSTQEPIASLTLSRPKFHHLLATLDRFAASAEWNIRDGAEWFGTSPIEIGKGRLVS